MGHAVIADKPGPIDAEDHGSSLLRHVVDHFVHCSLEEGGVNVAEGDLSLKCKTGGECDCVPLSDTDIENSVGVLTEHIAH